MIFQTIVDSINSSSYRFIINLVDKDAEAAIVIAWDYIQIINAYICLVM